MFTALLVVVLVAFLVIAAMCKSTDHSGRPLR
jgi:hypothetical protein